MPRANVLLIASILVVINLSTGFQLVGAQEVDLFAAKPYLQLGSSDNLVDKGLRTELELVWMSRYSDKWRLESRDNASDPWRAMPTPEAVFFPPSNIFIIRAPIKNLKPGASFEYRLLRGDQEIFKSHATAWKDSSQPSRFVVMGDIGAKTYGEKKVVFQVSLTKPDLMVLAGDIVYQYGLLSEYFDKLFPIYNGDKASASIGAPILRSVISVAALGNHDIALAASREGAELNKLQDALAYYLVWSQPLNGPLTDKNGANVPKVLGSDENLNNFFKAAQSRYPSMSNCSFDFGNAHWLILDANHYMDWTNQALRNWVAADLSKAKQARWKFVCFHQPGFSFDVAHYKEQRMRLLCDIFEKEGVDVVFSGHAHDYQRTYPLLFKANKKNGQPTGNADGTVSGELTLDKQFDGIKNTKPHGVIYIVTGAGGAGLYGSIQDKIPSMQKTFTDKCISNTHSFTVCDIDDSKLAVRQISEDGILLDQFIVKKDATK
jgi:predicted phosphodiesterase